MGPARALTLLVLATAACSGGPGSAVASPTAAGRSPAPSPAPSPPVGASPSSQPLPTQLPNFACADQSGGSAAVHASLTDVRVGANNGFDRFVLQFQGGVPAYSVRRQASATFLVSPRGEPVTLAGSAGVQVTLQQTTSSGSYGGSTDFKPNYAALKEARQLEDFEAVVQWGLGLGQATCVRAFPLTEPDRLVIDVATS